MVPWLLHLNASGKILFSKSHMVAIVYITAYLKDVYKG
jgi:hypothetical protein